MSRVSGESKQLRAGSARKENTDDLFTSARQWRSFTRRARKNMPPRSRRLAASGATSCGGAVPRAVCGSGTTGECGRGRRVRDDRRVEE
jgi:hypothetical protein